MNPYRQAWFDMVVPRLYERDPDALSQEQLDLYEDHLEALAENSRDDTFIPDKQQPDDVVSIDFDAIEEQDRNDAVAAYNGDAPWNESSRIYYLEHKDEVVALAG